MHRRLAGTTALLCAVTALGLSACRETIELPEELLGKYTTTDTSYSDRYFTVTPFQVVLGLGEGRSHSYDVTAVYGDVERGRLVYTVVYETPYGDDSLSFYTNRGEDGQIVLKNRPDTTWTRGESRQ